MKEKKKERGSSLGNLGNEAIFRWAQIIFVAILRMYVRARINRQDRARIELSVPNHDVRCVKLNEQAKLDSKFIEIIQYSPHRLPKCLMWWIFNPALSPFAGIVFYNASPLIIYQNICSAQRVSR